MFTIFLCSNFINEELNGNIKKLINNLTRKFKQMFGFQIFCLVRSNGDDYLIELDLAGAGRTGHLKH